MFQLTRFLISTAVQNILIEYSCIGEMISGMSVVCEWIDWWIVVQTWGWCNEFYGVHTVHTLRTVHILRTVCTLITVHTMYIVYIM